MKLCKCGCGGLVKADNVYINGHNILVQRNNRRVNSNQDGLCFCGCGKKVTREGNNFLKGHNPNSKGQQNVVSIFPRVIGKCGCGCEQDLIQRAPDYIPKYCPGHNTKGKILGQKNDGRGWPKGKPRGNFSPSHLNNLSTSHIGQKSWNTGLTKETDQRVAYTVEKQIEALEKLAEKGQLKQRWFNTIPELKIEVALQRAGLMYKKQHYIKSVGMMDFYLPEDNIIIECDGDYWHTLPGAQKKDQQKTLQMQKLGYKVFRFWERDINKNADACVARLSS